MLNIINQTKDENLKKYYKDIKKYFNATLDLLDIEKNSEVSLIIVADKKIKTINSTYRNRDNITDVISFALCDSDDNYCIDLELGDIFINKNRVYSQAKKYKHSIKREFCFLFVHGMLHLLGYDHMNKEDEDEMFKLQDRILGNLK